MTSEEVNSLLKEASQSYLKDILGFDEVPKVSTDYVNDSRSSIVDAACTQVGRTPLLAGWLLLAGCAKVHWRCGSRPIT